MFQIGGGSEEALPQGLKPGVSRRFYVGAKAPTRFGPFKRGQSTVNSSQSEVEGLVLRCMHSKR